MVENYGTVIHTIFLDHTRNNYLYKSVADVVMFDGPSSMHIGGELLKVNYTNILVMRGVEHTVYLFFNDV